MDDSIVAEIQWFQDGGRCTRALLPLASDGFRLLGKRGSDDPPIHVIRTADNQLGFAICSAGMHRGHRHAAIDDALLEWMVDTDTLLLTTPRAKV